MSKIHQDKRHRARADEITRQMAYRLGISAWLKITVRFDEDHSEDRIVCQTTADWEYRQASFLWNIHEVATMTDEEIQNTAIHELVHALIDPLWSALSDKSQEKTHKLNELATENVTRAIQHLMEEKS